ncbi:hypothetical protein FB45DRAFT_841793 [Roridomyces roridus]|uniref:Uncharacterized protein n=1 Tax=Roridomyces roridus TaxID=1738132 RepID=A0AAD7FEA9_9AGAR|nr:hypothetical protein FB45DRAFT_841793 [Roridomyces roridus]
MPAHIVCLLIPAWGHAVPYIQIATQLIQRDPALVITIVQHNVLVAQMEEELRRYAYDSSRLRLIGVGSKQITPGPKFLGEALKEIADGWMGFLPELAEGSDEWPTPRTIHMDFFGGGYVVEQTKETLGPTVKILVWWSTALVSMHGLLNRYDNAVIAQEIHDDEQRRAGRSLEDILDAVTLAANGTDKLAGEIVKNPGLSDMYDYEQTPFAAGLRPPIIGTRFAAAQKLAKLADGYIVPTSTCLEPVGVPYYKEYYKARGQELFTIGVQVQENFWQHGTDPISSVGNRTIEEFLSKSVREYGHKSVLYISFGSVFFPIMTPDLIQALVQTLLDLPQPFPFLFVLGSKLAAMSLPAELIQRVNASGRGLIFGSWVNQGAILRSGAVGWFLAHGGFNSIGESLSLGIPLIFWPVAAEQSINAALLASDPNPVALELFQVRVGPQRAPSLRTSVAITGSVVAAEEEFRATFAEARGERGGDLRANAEGLAKKLREVRGGEGRTELQRLAGF